MMKYIGFLFELNYSNYFNIDFNTAWSAVANVIQASISSFPPLFGEASMATCGSHATSLVHPRLTLSSLTPFWGKCASLAKTNFSSRQPRGKRASFPCFPTRVELFLWLPHLFQFQMQYCFLPSHERWTVDLRMTPLPPFLPKGRTFSALSGHCRFIQNIWKDKEVFSPVESYQTSEPLDAALF